MIDIYVYRKFMHRYMFNISRNINNKELTRFKIFFIKLFKLISVYIFILNEYLKY